MIRPFALLIAALAFAPLSPAAAEDDPLREFQRLEARLYTAGYRLALANAPFCEETIPASGFAIHDAASYSEAKAVRAQLGLRGDIGVQAVAPGSPAEVAGLRRDDTILAIGGRMVETTWPPTKEGWQRQVTLLGAIASEGEDGTLDLLVARPGSDLIRLSIPTAPTCASRFEVLDSSDAAWADGKRVAMGRKWPPFAYEDENAFAASVAHELAHNVLGHLVTRKETGRKRSLIRLSERDADRIMPWLLWNAGYDPRGAVRWMQAWGPKHGGGLLRKRTHDGWDERVEFIEAEIATLEAKIAEHGWSRGEADWRTHFRQELAEELARREAH
ncbi:M48 family metallopeptidase [Qipengyuania aquimaris]|uniref:M48 family metallopeptidase n=1 Tax=Qipengyuania aquimaris TaxID=255984 RepID=UPI001FD031F9|nr:M48 family metallopeptidase [Qipengyuania aquimaris]UOR16087.1 M48 family metallopeptidase [Qipengyuania aquimaris]